MNKLTIFTIGFLIILFSCSQSNSQINDQCIENNGKWISSANECEGISGEMCVSLGGEFNDCASACRNNPGVIACTEQCVQVCSFNKDN